MTTYKWTRGQPTREDSDQSPSVGDLVRGAVGVAKAALGVQAAPDETVRARWAECLACDSHDAGRCTACGCFTGAKVRVAGETCPRGKWQAVTIEGASAKRGGCCGRRKTDPQGDQ
jgi:hypothetical protein